MTALLAVLAGCASVGERKSRYEFNLEADARRVEPDDTGSAGVPEPGEDAGLQDYLAYAALRNPGLQAAFDDWKAELERIPQARSLPDPRFTYVHYIETVETRVGPQEQSFALMQTFPWLGKLRRRGDIAFAASEAARQRYEAAKLKLFYEVKHAYYEYYYLSRAISVTENDIRLVSSLEEVARTKYQVGEVPYSAVVKAQVELGVLEDALETLQDLSAPTIAGLNKVLGRPPGAYLPPPKIIEAEDVRFRDEDIVADLKKRNPELLTLEFMTLKEEAALGLSRQVYLPDITLGATIVRTGEALDPMSGDSGKDPVMASLSLNLPLWIGKYRAAEKEAQARLSASARRRQNRENQLVTDLKFAIFHFRSAERKADLYGNSLILKAEQALAASQRAFAAGRADFFDIIEAQRTLLEFLLAYERALADRAQRLAEIEMLTGSQIERGPGTLGGEGGESREQGTR
jgi:outer membrane protein TolC